VKELPYVINMTLPDEDQIENYVHRIGRVGRADRMGLAISLVATSGAEEKVWYCPKGRYPPCEDTSLYSQGGNCKWYNESKLLGLIEKRLKQPIEAMTSDFQLPPGLAALGAVYGQEMGNTEETSAYIEQLTPDVQELCSMETAAQQNWWDIKKLLARSSQALGQKRRNHGDSDADVDMTAAYGNHATSARIQALTHDISGAVATSVKPVSLRSADAKMELSPPHAPPPPQPKLKLKLKQGQTQPPQTRPQLQQQKRPQPQQKSQQTRPQSLPVSAPQQQRQNKPPQQRSPATTGAPAPAKKSKIISLSGSSKLKNPAPSSSSSTATSGITAIGSTKGKAGGSSDGSDKAGAAAMPPKKLTRGDWICPACNKKVFASKNACFACHTPRPGSSGGAGAGGSGSGGTGAGDTVIRVIKGGNAGGKGNGKGSQSQGQGPPRGRKGGRGSRKPNRNNQ
jgi:hypothetical protein